MAKRVLVAYASRCGSTEEVAQFIGQRLCEAGLSADVQSVKSVRDVSAYDAVVLGGAVRMNHLLGETVRCAKKHRQALANMPVAYFSASGTMKENTPENVATAAGFLAPLREIQAPISEASFAGKMDLATMEPLFRMMMSRSAEEMGDWRDWDAIGAWSADLAARLQATA